MKLSKSDYILREIIKAYISEQSPVASLFLQESLNVPASTLRLYFKRLSDDGMLSKQHASSGRTPTCAAMKNYWKEQIARKNLSTHEIRVLNDLAFFKLIDEFELFCMVIDESPSFLRDIINIKNRHIFLEFDDFCVVLGYEEHLFALFSELALCATTDILQVLERYQLSAASRKIINALSEQRVFSFGTERLFKMARKNPSELNNLGILSHFPASSRRFNLASDELLNDEFLGISARGHYINTPANFIICGSIYTDFDRFFNSIKEVV